MSTIVPPFCEGKRLSRPTKRCLFGKPNKIQRQHLETALSVQENKINQITEDVKRFKERWGFDPVSGKPVVGGLYECVPADAKEIPSVYLKGYARRKNSVVSKPRVPSSPINLTNFNLSAICVRPSVKRKLPLDFEDDVNDENTNVSEAPIVSDTSRVQVPVEPMVLPTPSSSVESSPMSDSSYPSPLSLQEQQHRTPKQHQSQIKDFFQIKKQRPCSSTKQNTLT